MALFKIFRGREDDLKNVPYHEGYAYFTEDKQHLFIDVGNLEGDRLQVNAYAAQVLSNGVTEIDIDDVFLKTMTAGVAQGGTGANSLTVNALLVGNGTNPIKMVPLEAGSVAVGDATNGVKGLKGTGALYAATAGAPSFGTLPISVGGTGATTQSAARANLDVYSKSEVDNSVSGATRKAYTTTLYANQWIENGDSYTYSYANTSLTCGVSHDIPPIITYTSNREEYNDIESAQATPGAGIVFTASKKPANDIGLIIVDR